MNYWYLFIPALVFFLLGIIGIIRQGEMEDQKEALKEYYKADDKVGRALDSSSRRHVKETLQEYEAAYQDSKNYLSAASRSLHYTDKEDLQAHLKDLEEEAWLKKAEKHLEAFSVYFAKNGTKKTSGRPAWYVKADGGKANT